MVFFDRFKKKIEPIKEKVFKDYFIEIQSDMVFICLESVENNADKIYIYASFEANVISADYSYDVNSAILERYKLNDANNGFNYDVSGQR